MLECSCLGQSSFIPMVTTKKIMIDCVQMGLVKKLTTDINELQIMLIILDTGHNLQGKQTPNNKMTGVKPYLTRHDSK